MLVAIGVLCFAGVGGLILWGGAYLIREGIQDRDGIEIGLGAFVVLLTIGLAAGLIAEAREDATNPCVAWGAPVTSYIYSNGTLIPVTTTPCTQRQNTTER